MAEKRTAADSVPRSTTPHAERGTLSSKRETTRGTQSGTVIGGGSPKPTPHSAAGPAKRNGKRNGKRKISVSGRSAGNNERNAIATAGEHRAETPAYVPSKVWPVDVLLGASQAEQARQVSRGLTAPEAAATRIILAAEGKSAYGELLDVPGTLAELRRVAAEVNTGDLSRAEAMLMNQAQALQTLATRLIERGLSQEMFCHFEGFLRLGLRAQAQSRQAIETLAVLKQGPAVFARQANVAHGPQQVVNGAALPPCAPAIENQPNQLSLPHEQRLDRRAPSSTSQADQAMAPVGEKHRAENR